MENKVKTIYSPVLFSEYYQSLFEGRVPAGFPSPAADYEENKLDLNKYLIKHPVATFFVRVIGDSMVGAGISCGDLLIVDRSLEPRDKNVIIAALDGELTVKRIRIRKDKITLVPENDNYPAKQISQDMDFEIWGVVTSVIHQL
jgi:DNA polymerase V